MGFSHHFQYFLKFLIDEFKNLFHLNKKRYRSKNSIIL